MAIEQALLDALNSYARKPTLNQAKLAFLVPAIQNAAIAVATDMRTLAVQIDNHRRDIEKKPPLNWRNFLVGSAAVGIAPAREGDFNWFVSTAWNTKPHPNQEKFCAERRNNRRLIRQGCTCLIGVATVGLLNKNGDDRSLRNGPNETLDMCERCRDDALGEFRNFYCEETLVINEHPVTHNRTKPRTMSEIFAHHDEVWWRNDPKVVGLFWGG